MLYISRVLGRTRVEVTDTEDGVAEIWNTKDLEKLVVENIDKFEIKGMEWVYGRQYKYTASTPTLTSKTLKQYMLNGIRLDIKDGVLVCFSLDKPLIQNTTLVLSKYCNKIENYAFKVDSLSYHGRRGEPVDAVLTIVLDDNIDVSPYAFNDWKGKTLKAGFDITSVTSTKIVKKVYNVWGHDTWHSFMFDHWRVVDNRERFLGYAAEGLLKTDFRHEHLLDTYDRDDIEFMSNYISKKYKKKLLKWIKMIKDEEFKYTDAHLMRKNIYLSGKPINRDTAEQYKLEDVLFASVTFSDFEDNMCHTILHELECKKEVGVLKNYAKLFHRDYEIMTAWHDMLYTFFIRYVSYMYRFERTEEGRYKRVCVKI